MGSPERIVVLGIDAAWTVRRPSGVALVVREGARRRTLACAPCEAAFVALARGESAERSQRPECGALDLGALVDAAAELAGAPPDAIGVDMPLARGPFASRRAADDAVSRAFGRAKCATHSPLPGRPGALADAVREAAEERGYLLATTTWEVGCGARALLEVYPHAALLGPCDADERLPYKVSRSSKLWPGTSVAERVERLLEPFRRIVDALRPHVGDAPLELPRAEDVRTLAELKRWEDALDARVCAYAAAAFVDGDAEPFGDDFAAIWVPRLSCERVSRRAPRARAVP
ncbi:MAG: DUF429 domain-containing protein [Planctomycetota bacterium]